jgi:hypothetical protein
LGFKGSDFREESNFFEIFAERFLEAKLCGVTASSFSAGWKKHRVAREIKKALFEPSRRSKPLTSFHHLN